LPLLADLLKYHRVEDFVRGLRRVGRASPHEQLDLDPHFKEDAYQGLSLNRQT
jgi:hypothetical protein